MANFPERKGRYGAIEEGNPLTVIGKKLHGGSLLPECSRLILIDPRTKEIRDVTLDELGSDGAAIYPSQFFENSNLQKRSSYLQG